MLIGVGISAWMYSLAASSKAASAGVVTLNRVLVTLRATIATIAPPAALLRLSLLAVAAGGAALSAGWLKKLSGDIDDIVGPTQEWAGTVNELKLAIDEARESGDKLSRDVQSKWSKAWEAAAEAEIDAIMRIRELEAEIDTEGPKVVGGISELSKELEREKENLNAARVAMEALVLTTRQLVSIGFDLSENPIAPPPEMTEEMIKAQAAARDLLHPLSALESGLVTLEKAGWKTKENIRLLKDSLDAPRVLAAATAFENLVTPCRL